ncbi:HesA/MoeB/ThiF family protein [Plastorhodobacter daqingensis]|uniref:HesA/MoeB/ThiF family protein n=1 Tax=Plastorhodobacter daqingensis TaxID=1387281 RepID=A0ABW2UKR8_9RHOB
MALVLVLAATIWGVGWAMKAPRRHRLAMIGLLLLAVVLLQLVLPQGHPIREATGGSAVVWLVLAGIVALLYGYGMLLGRLRRRGAPVEAPAGTAGSTPATMRPAELDRYARHIMLREIGGPGQKALRKSRVLVLGAGGLGSPVLLYLAAAGVGTIGIIDDDVVDNSNLQRQIIHADARIGMPKVFSAQIALEALNPFVTIRPYYRRLTEDIAPALFADYDLIVDGTDNFDTRYLANRIAVSLGKPLISGAMSQWEGQISLFHPQAGTPCYECIFPTRPAPGLAPSCAEAGVVAPLPGVIGAMMALEVIKHLAGAGQGLGGRMLIHDALFAETRTIALRKRPDCPTCAAG